MICSQTSVISWLIPHRAVRLAAAFLFIFPVILSAQIFEAEVTSKEVVLGSSFELTFTLKDAQGSRFKAPDLAGDYKIIGGPSEMRGMTIINGRSTTRQSWTYELEPKRTGTFTIGAASVQVNGKVLNTQPVTIKVVQARARPNVNALPGATDNLFIEGQLNMETAYPGQQVTWRIVLYTQLSIDGADIIELPDFDGFYAKEKRRFDTRVTYQTIRGKRYAVKVLHEEALFPLETGEVTIGAAKVRIGVDQGGRLGSFLIPKPVLFQTQPVSLKVKSLPEPVPQNFTGGVGQYDWSTQLDRDSLSTDDAFTLTLSIRGNGDAKRFAAPKLSLQPGLEVFDPKVKEEEEYENGEEVVHTRVLEYVVLPREPGQYSLNPELVYFDTDSNRYRTLRADNLPVVRVTAGKNYGINQSADTIPVLPPAVPPRTDIWEGLSEWVKSPLLWTLLMLPLLVYAAFALWKKRKNRKPAQTRPRSAIANAKNTREWFANVTGLLNEGNPRAFYDELFKSIQGFLASRLAITPALMTQENVRRMLAERGVPAGTIQDLLSVWQTCEQAVFAGQTQSAQMAGTLRTAESVVQVLDKSLR